MTQISVSEVKFAKESHADDVGKVFFWRGRVFRAIREDKVVGVEQLLASGLLQELSVSGLFPNSWQTDYQLASFGMVIEHERIPTVTYPYEWSFSMLRDASLVILRVNQIARLYGYQTKDAHGYNVLFHGSHPLFVDFGSFVRIKPGHNDWLGYDEYMKFFYYPLRLWSDGNEFLAQRILSGTMLPLMPHESYIAYKFPIMRHVNNQVRRRVARFPFFLERFLALPQDEIKQFWPGKKGAVLSRIRSLKILPRNAASLSLLIRKIERLKAKEEASIWGTYQIEGGLVDETGTLRPSPRFERIAELIDQLHIRHVVELAGNQGAFARYLLATTQVKKITCTDYDTNAIEQLYRAVGTDQRELTPAVLNFVAPIRLSGLLPPHHRMRAEAVIALAVTHHLLLTQHIPIDRILQSLCSFAERYVFVEFMPLGLYNGMSAPETPSWYRLEWFRDACNRHFSIVIEEHLEENRILFVGQLN